jgi:uncharacterized membrane protein required for colicin V production
MFQDILLNFNWIDALILAFVIRGVFVGALRGVGVEFFKFIGMIVATILTLHFYTRLGILLSATISLPKGTNELLAFFLIWSLAVLVFKIVREGWMLLYKSEEISTASRLTGGVLAIFRTLLFSGLVFILLFLSGNRFLVKSARKAYVSCILVELSPRFYDVTFEGMISRLFPSEKKNQQVFTLIQTKDVK